MIILVIFLLYGKKDSTPSYVRKLHETIYMKPIRARSLVVSDLRSEAKSSRFESGY